MQVSVAPRASLGIPVHISNVYFSETREITSQLGAIPEKLLQFGVSRLTSQMHLATWSNIFLQTLL